MTESFPRNGRSRVSMTIQTKNLILAPHLPRHLRALLRGPQEFENMAGLCVAGGIRGQFFSASFDFMNKGGEGGGGDPWRVGFCGCLKKENIFFPHGGGFRPP